MKVSTKPSCIRTIEIYEKQGCRCIYCLKKPDRATWDHIVPLSEGGEDSYDNLCIACHKCNHQKGNLSAEMFLDGYIADYVSGRDQGDDSLESILVPRKFRSPRRWYHLFLKW